MKLLLLLTTLMITSNAFGMTKEEASLSMIVYEDMNTKKIQYNQSLCKDYNQAARVLSLSELNCIKERKTPDVGKVPEVAYLSVTDIMEKIYQDEYVKKLVEQEELMDQAIDRMNKSLK